MDLRATIEEIFGGKAFERPLFYAWKEGLRFSLSEGGTAINQVFVAMTKAQRICEAVFAGDESVGVCLRLSGAKRLLYAKAEFQELRDAQIRIPRERCIWSESAGDEHQPDSGVECWHNIAFLAPKSLLVNLLWCAFVQDFGMIAPRPGFLVYLFSVESQLLVWPYDDRGMDVAGPNHEALSALYRRFNDYLLDYDRPAMAAVFER